MDIYTKVRFVLESKGIRAAQREFARLMRSNDHNSTDADIIMAANLVTRW